MPDLDLEAIWARWRTPLSVSLAAARADIAALIREVEELRIDRERLQRLYHMALHDGLPEGGADA